MQGLRKTEWTGLKVFDHKVPKFLEFGGLTDGDSFSSYQAQKQVDILNIQIRIRKEI